MPRSATAMPTPGTKPSTSAPPSSRTNAGCTPRDWSNAALRAAPRRRRQREGGEGRVAAGPADQQPVALHIHERGRGVEPGERVAQVAVQAVELTGVELARVLVGDRAEPDRACEPPGERERIKRLRGDRRHLRLARREL